MPTSPERLIEQKLQLEAPVREKLIKLIEETLQREFEGSGTVSITLESECTKLSKLSKERISTTFLAHDWHVEFKSSYDGSWVAVTPVSEIRALDRQ